MKSQEAQVVRQIPYQGQAMPDDGRSDQLLALVGHELRSPLSAIRNALKVFRRCGDDDALRNWAEGVMDRQTQKMDCLVEEMMQFSRICCGKVQLEKRQVDLSAVVARTVETVRHRIDERGQVLEVTLPPEPVRLLANPTQLEQVLTNLLENAVKYSSSGGRIGLTAALDGNNVAICVQDGGIGITQDALSHVFDMFWQSSPDCSGGFGIGLALVRKLVEMHGGSVSAYSAGLGQGSEFMVLLPLNEITDDGDGTPGIQRGDPTWNVNR